MLKFFAILLLVFASCTVYGQGTERTVQKPEGNFTYHHFEASNKVSSEIFWSSQGSIGHAKAFDLNGATIYHEELSRMHMVRSVRFTYHPNGAVSNAVLSWHPDGGIQRGTVTTTFDPNGSKLGETKWSNEDRPGIMDKHLLQPEEEPVPPPAQIVVEEGPIFENTVFFINRSRRSFTLHLLDNTGKPVSEREFKPTLMQPGDTVQGKAFYMIGVHTDPSQSFQIKLESPKPKQVRDIRFDCKQGRSIDLSPQRRKTFYDLSAPSRR